MGMDPVTIGLIVSSVASAGAAVAGGQQQRSAAKRQANQVLGASMVQAQESSRIAAKEAAIEREASEDAVRRQKLSYMKSGVDLEGSPLLMMEATRQRGARNVDEILSAGGARGSAIQSEGRMAADNYRSAGRQAFMSGLGSAVSTGANYAMSQYTPKSSSQTFFPNSGTLVTWND